MKAPVRGDDSVVAEVLEGVEEEEEEEIFPALEEEDVVVGEEEEDGAGPSPGMFVTWMYDRSFMASLITSASATIHRIIFQGGEGGGDGGREERGRERGKRRCGTLALRYIVSGGIGAARKSLLVLLPIVRLPFHEHIAPMHEIPNTIMLRKSYSIIYISK